MNAEELREYVLQKTNVTEGFPFGEDTLVFKVSAKIFVLVALESSPLQFNVKCDPDEAINLREQYPESVLPGYHMNKKHWNTVHCDRSLDDSKVRELVGHSYDLVRASLPKTLREELENL